MRRRSSLQWLTSGREESGRPSYQFEVLPPPIWEGGRIFPIPEIDGRRKKKEKVYTLVTTTLPCTTVPTMASLDIEKDPELLPDGNVVLPLYGGLAVLGVTRDRKAPNPSLRIRGLTQRGSWLHAQAGRQAFFFFSFRAARLGAAKICS